MAEADVPAAPPPAAAAPAQSPAMLSIPRHPSSQLPSIPFADAKRQLEALGFQRGRARGRGDCFPLSACAGREITKAAAAVPSAATTETVRLLRDSAIGRITGDAAVGGIDAVTFRVAEGLSADPQEAEDEMSAWRETGYWYGEGSRFASFMLGVSLELSRPVIVIERAGNDREVILNPARIYGARTADGELRHSIPTPNAPETVPSWFIVPFDELIATLKADPKSCSLIEFNGTNHFDPWLLVKRRTRAALLPSNDPTAMGPELTDAALEQAKAPEGQPVPAKRSATEADICPDPGDAEVASITEEAERTHRKAKMAKKATATVLAVSVVEEQTPLTLTDALDGAFAGLTPIEQAPEWLEAALELKSTSAKQLHGRHVAFHWEGEWGWAVGRLGSSSQRDANFAVLYEAGWREQQTLTIEAYGRGEPGSWLLLEREPSSASSIISFKNGKYLVGDAWLRASELVHYSSADLDAARLAAVTAKRAAEGDAVNEELAVGDHTIGSVVYVKGNAAAGEAWFEAEVIGHRERCARCTLLLVNNRPALTPISLN